MSEQTLKEVLERDDVKAHIKLAVESNKNRITGLIENALYRASIRCTSTSELRRSPRHALLYSLRAIEHSDIDIEGEFVTSVPPSDFLKRIITDLEKSDEKIIEEAFKDLPKTLFEDTPSDNSTEITDASSTEFQVYSVGACFSSVCSALSIEETTKRVNEMLSPNNEIEWKLNDDKKFANGTPMPHQCPDHAANKHYLFSC